MCRVVVFQEYVAAYRGEFWRRLQARASVEGIEVVVAAGQPHGPQRERADAVTVPGLFNIEQTEHRVFGKRVTVRDISSATRGADFLILEQARRNVDAYRLLARRKRRIPVALWGHGRDYTHVPSGLDRGLHKWLTRRADWFFAYTEGGRDAVVALGYPENRVAVVRNTIDMSRLQNDISNVTQADIDTFSSVHDLHGRTALFLGGLDESKRIQFLLAAAKNVASFDEGFRLVIAGAGVDAERVKRSVPFSPWLKYIGPVSGSMKATALASSQVIAMPGRVGLIAVDSFASGRPIITTDWPLHAPEFEYLKNGQNAIVTADSVLEYGKALRDVVKDEMRLRSLQEAALLESPSYDLNEMVERFLAGLISWRRSPWTGRRASAIA